MAGFDDLLAAAVSADRRDQSRGETRLPGSGPWLSRQ